jgi:PII-like signaling protein
MVSTVSAKRIEILCDTPLVPRIVGILRASGIKGWSVLHVESGGGRDGEWRQDEFTGAAAKTIVLAIAKADTAAAFTDALAPMLDSYGLLLIVGDVQVVRADRF